MMSNKKDSLGDRMKGYENVPRHYLVRRMPVIIRLDGKAFHTFTRGLKKPFDDTLMTCMTATAQYLCESIQGCKLAYVQSDEISLLLTDYDNLESEPWFKNNIQKMVSVSASMATLAFNRTLMDIVEMWSRNARTEEEHAYLRTLQSKLDSALFDSRVWNLPKEEVINYFIWRQQDATRNSIQMLGQYYFSHKELHGKNTGKIQDMLFTQHGINFNDIPTPKKRGTCIVKTYDVVTVTESEVTTRTKWEPDNNIPIFTQDRDYINKLAKYDEER
jgi:tRNA(His) 5'-end guanylyltransferase